jgi:hypothetical protein
MLKTVYGPKEEEAIGRYRKLHSEVLNKLQDLKEYCNGS